MTYLGIFYDMYPTRPWLFCEAGIPVILVGFNSFCQLPLSIWLISTIKWVINFKMQDWCMWVRILKLSFLYQSFLETVLVARYQKVFLGKISLFDHCCQYCIALGRNESLIWRFSFLLEWGWSAFSSELCQVPLIGNRNQ